MAEYINEVWKDCGPYYPDVQVSNFGNVRKKAIVYDANNNSIHGYIKVEPFYTGECAFCVRIRNSYGYYRNVSVEKLMSNAFGKKQVSKRPLKQMIVGIHVCDMEEIAAFSIPELSELTGISSSTIKRAILTHEDIHGWNFCIGDCYLV